MSFRVGDTIGEYKIVGPLGRGGMGQVFRVEHTLTKRIEAMKVLVKHPLEGVEPVSRFLREVKIHASLNHPNIVTVHNAFQVGDDLALVMELVDGRSLKELVRAGELSVDAAVRAVCGALEGLEYAHQRNVIHRDISPSNIIVTSGGVAKLMDFGLSKEVVEPGLGQSGVVLGTVYYCSPEQVQSKSLDVRSDIYSLGVVLYEAVTSRRPFESETPFNIMMDHVETQPVPPIEVNPAVPRAVNDVILKAMAKVPGDRFQSAGELRLALETGVGQDARSISPSTPKTAFWQTLADVCTNLAGRRSVQIALVALALAFPVTVVCVNAIGLGAPAPDPPVARWTSPPVPAGALELSPPPLQQEPQEQEPHPDLPQPQAPPQQEHQKRASRLQEHQQRASQQLAPERQTPEHQTAQHQAQKAVLVKRVNRPEEPILTSEPSAPVPTVSASTTPEPNIEADEAPPVDASPGTPAPGEPERKPALKRFFGKVFHRKSKAAAAADKPASQGSLNAAKP